MTKSIILICEQCLSRNYHLKRNRLHQERLVLKKYCPKCNAATIHKETK